MERLLDYFVPEKYTLDLTIEKAKKAISGKVLVTGVAKAENIKFHAVGLSVDFVKINGKTVGFSVEDGLLSVFEAPRGDLEVEIGYHGSLNENMQGAYLSTYEYQGRTEVIVATQFESHYAREAFPCIDEPAAKAEFGLTIRTPDTEDILLANTPITTDEKIDGFRVVTFKPTPRMSTYLLAFVMGKFHGRTIRNKHGVEITTYAALNQDLSTVDFANEVAARSLEFFDDNFGVPYPLPKLDQVALPDFEAGAMENWGLVTYRESMLLAGRNATLATKKSVALTIAHELSHQWFGDLVTMEWWDDLWLNESFASVVEYFAVDAIYPEFKIFEGFFVSDSLSALKRDMYSDVQSVHQDVSSPAEIATLFDPSIVYSKGARLMLMLIRMMGWEKFCEGIAKYFEKFKYQNTVGDDLWASLQEFADFDVKEMMHAFIERPGYPVITDGEQKRFVVDGEMAESSWPIPEIVEDMSGHYILNLSDEEFNERLARFDTLSLEEKLRLLIDRMLLAKTELVSSASLIPLVAKFKDETSAAVWDILVSIIAGLKIFFEPGSEEEKRFKKFVGELVRPGILKVGLKTREEDDENMLRLRSILLALDYYAETEENIKALAEMYDSDVDRLDAEIREHILAAKIYVDPKVSEEFLKKYVAEADPEIKFELLFSLTLSKDEKNVAKMIELLEKPEIVKPQDQFHLFIYLFRNAVAKEKAFAWLTSHWDFVKSMAGDKSLDNYPRYMAGSIRTEKQAEEYVDFFGPMRDDLALARAIVIGEKEIQAQLALIEKDQGSVIEAL